jgi:hypothetical protein
LRQAIFSVALYTAQGVALVNCCNDYSDAPFALAPPEGEVRCRIGRLPLVGGQYWLNVFCELGGEFVDTGHEDLQKLGAELGVEMEEKK